MIEQRAFLNGLRVSKLCHCLPSVNLPVLVLGMQLCCLEMKPPVVWLLNGKEGFWCLYCNVVLKQNLNVSCYTDLDDAGAFWRLMFTTSSAFFFLVFLLFTCVLRKGKVNQLTSEMMLYCLKTCLKYPLGIPS